MTNQVQLYELDQMERMANAIAKSGLFGVKEPLQALALMLMAQAEGLHPATIAQDYDIISGRAARKTHSVLARFQQAGGKVKWLELTDTCAKAEFSHPDGGTVTMDWDINRAKRTTVWNGKLNGGKGAFEPLADRAMYRSYPRSMLRARCIAEGIRAVYPAAIGGMLVEEEARDVEEIDVTPKRPEVEQPQPKNKPSAATPQDRTVQQPTDTTAAPAANEHEAAQAVPDTRPDNKVPHVVMPGTPSAPASATDITMHTLAECLALADQHFKAGHVQEATTTLDVWRKDLTAEDQTTLDSTFAALLAEQEAAPKKDAPPKKLMIEGMKKIIRARLKSNDKTIEQLEAQFGKLDEIAFDDFQAVQNWCVS